MSAKQPELNKLPFPTSLASQQIYSAFKRMMDFCLASIILLIAAPALLLAALLHARNNGKQIANRLIETTDFVGMAGKRFRLHRVKLLPEGKIAAFLRNLGIEHCLYFYAVLLGNMSIVGPRPRTVAEYQPSYDQILAAKPGLVCLWWLRQHSNIDFEQELVVDTEYLHQRSLRTDLAIACRALIVLIYGRPSAQHAACQTIIGIRLLNLAMDDLLSAVLSALRSKQASKIAFVNADCVNIAAHDAEYLQCIQQMDWVCADGIGMKIAGHLLNREIRQNINGTDLFPPLCQLLADGAYSIYLLGAKTGVAAQVAQHLQQKYPNLRVAGYHDGYFDSTENSAIVDQIRAAQTDVLFVAMGAPLQEKWIQANFTATGACICMGVGGLFDFYSGRIPRAPLWLREIGGEWLYRLLQEPGRMWRRYLVGNLIFLGRVILEKWRHPQN